MRRTLQDLEEWEGEEEGKEWEWTVGEEGEEVVEADEEGTAVVE